MYILYILDAEKRNEDFMSIAEIVKQINNIVWGPATLFFNCRDWCILNV